MQIWRKFLMANRDKQIQIPETLFAYITAYFLGNRDKELEDKIIQGIEDKYDRMANHDLYSTYKDSSLPAAEKERARRNYLQARGIHPDFIWPADFKF